MPFEHGSGTQGHKWVYAPKRVIEKRSYKSATGKKRHLLFLEVPPNNATIGRRRFRENMKLSRRESVERWAGARREVKVRL